MTQDQSYTDTKELEVHLAYEEHLKPGAFFGPAIRVLYYIECCTEGRGTITINGKEFPIQAGDSYVLLPGDAVRHTADTVNPRAGFCCGLRGQAIEHCLQDAGITSESPFIDAARFHDIRYWMEQLVEHWNHKDAGAPLRQLGCAYGILGAILQSKHSSESKSVVNRAIAYMETDFASSLTVGEIAKTVGLEQSYLSVLFKQHTGVSPYKYLTQLRVHKACQLIQAGQHSISEVADHVGLDSHNFARIFRRELGVSPTIYYESLQSGTPISLDGLITEL